MSTPSPAPTKAISTPSDVGFGMETTASFERHLFDAEQDAQKLNSELQTMNKEVKEFEKQIRQETEDAELEQEDQDFVIEDLCYLRSEEERAAELAAGGNEGEWIPETILGRKVKVGNKKLLPINGGHATVQVAEKDRIFYKVKWRGVNCVTWELAENISAPKLIQHFDDTWLRKAFAKSSPRLCFRRPKKQQSAGGASAPNKASTAAGDRSQKGSWSCELEPGIFVPYDVELQQQIERAYTSGLSEVRIQIGGPHFNISFTKMTQERCVGESDKVVGALAGGASTRQVQRTIQLSEEDERKLTENMSVEELRAYVANIVDFTPLHYELLSRLHEMDKVVVSASEDALAKLKKVSFEIILTEIAEEGGEKEYPGFSNECLLCLEDYEPAATVVVLGCGHLFHQDCVENYLQKYSNNCPACKAEVN